MKTRIITALIGLPILIIILFLHNTIFFSIAVAIVSAVGVYELLHSTKYVKNKLLIVFSLLFSLIVPFAKIPGFEKYFTLATIAFVALLLSVLFANHATLMFSEVAICFTGAMLVPYAMSSIVFVRDLQPEIGIYSILLVFACAWISDIGAYFVGMLLGKHKLAPTISPKKTIEGAVGGVAFCVIFNIVFAYIYMSLAAKSGMNYEVNLLALIFVSLSASMIGILGDLSASIIKRQTGIKDFGNLMPGHGGVLDRFDSILFIAPYLYVILQIVPILTIAT